MESLIEVKDLYFKYNNEEFWTLEDINFKVNRGDYLVIIGPNGGGKTTLLKLILGLISPEKGKVNLNVDRSKIGYLPQYLNIKRDFPITVKNAIMYGLPKDRPVSREDYLEIIDELKLSDLLEKKVSDLSGGQLQRVLLARAVVSQPELLILDEPTSNIDPYGTFCFFSYLEKLNDKMTILMVTHNLGLIMSGVKSVACVNRRLLYLDKPQINHDMIDLMYGMHDSHSCQLGKYLHDEIKHIMGGING
jgi:zinc transport system ATP-binding protein